jgi:hypothetical protein
MKYDATPNEGGNLTPLFRCHVIADDPGAAMEKIRTYLRAEGQRELAKAPIYLVDIGASVNPEMLVIELPPGFTIAPT